MQLRSRTQQKQQQKLDFIDLQIRNDELFT